MNKRRKKPIKRVKIGHLSKLQEWEDYTWDDVNEFIYKAKTQLDNFHKLNVYGNLILENSSSTRIQNKYKKVLDDFKQTVKTHLNKIPQNWSYVYT